jgi:hypothetical protein
MPNYDAAGNVTMTPEQKMQQLASMSPAELADTFRQARIYVQMEQAIGASMPRDMPTRRGRQRPSPRHEAERIRREICLAWQAAARARAHTSRRAAQ